MTARRRLGAITLTLVGLATAGCASEPGTGMRAASWAPIGYLGAPSIEIAPKASAENVTGGSPATIEAPRKTLGSKVLSAMALERATGRKPDPSRLNELD